MSNLFIFLFLFIKVDIFFRIFHLKTVVVVVDKVIEFYSKVSFSSYNSESTLYTVVFWALGFIFRKIM